MIIWGSYVKHKLLKHGQFHCPSCDAERNFVHKQPRKWGHLYWIPLIPLEDFDAYIECTNCRKAFNESVLDYNPKRDAEALQARLAQAVVRIVKAIAVAQNERIDRDYMSAFLKSFLGLEAPPDAALAEVDLDLHPESVIAAARDVAGNLTPQGKERLLHEALGSEAVGEGTERLVLEIGDALGLSPAHLHGILAQVRQENARRRGGAA